MQDVRVRALSFLSFYDPQGNADHVPKKRSGSSEIQYQ